jgi:uncharacterized membrane protein YhfC
MFLYGIVLMVAGGGLLAGVAALATWLHRRFSLPYALLTVGVLTYMGALVVQFVLLRALDHTLLEILPVGALAVGLAAGFTEETARLLGYQYLARGAVNRLQALMIGLGHGFSETIYTGLLAAGLGLSVLGYGSDRPDDLSALTSGALAEALNGLLPLAMHMGLSWVVLQVFLRGQLFWLFAAIFIHIVAETTAALIGPNDAWAVVLWRALVALIGLILITRLNAPELAVEETG